MCYFVFADHLRIKQGAEVFFRVTQVCTVRGVPWIAMPDPEFHGDNPMTSRNLFEALRADVRAKFELISSVHELGAAHREVVGALGGLRDSVQRLTQSSPAESVDRSTMADLMVFEELLAILGESLVAHKSAIDAALFDTRTKHSVES